MLKTIQAKPLFDPQASEFHVEHPEVALVPASLPTDQPNADVGDHLVVSPYTSLPHLLDLRCLEESQRLLAKALTVLEAIREDYATAPYIDSFNWTAVFARLKDLVRHQNYSWLHQHFYIVVFRSQVPPTTVGLLSIYLSDGTRMRTGLLVFRARIS